MYEKVQTVGMILLLGLCLFAGIKWLILRYGPVKSVKAKVLDKHKTEVVSKYAGSGKAIRYVVTFEIAGKRKGFYVSEFSYGGYRKGETGTLKYQGNRIIDFH